MSASSVVFTAFDVVFCAFQPRATQDIEIAENLGFLPTGAPDGCDLQTEQGESWVWFKKETYTEDSI